MNLFIMNFIIFARKLVLALIVSFLFANVAQAFDFEKIATKDGPVYREVFIVDVDNNGMMFRHADGIAKVRFEQLPMNLRMLYEPADDGAELTVEPEEKNVEPTSEKARPVFYVTLQQPVRYVPVYQYYQPCYQQAWPRHWPRYHPAHAYARPACRAAVVQDFLYTTGLQPKPPGVVTRRLPYNRPYLY